MSRNLEQIIDFSPQFLWSLLKFIVVFGIGYIIYDRLVDYNQNQNIQSFLDFNWENTGNWTLLLVCSLLMVLNWFLESFKWKLLLNSFTNVSLFKALESVLVGLAFGIVTPSRLGEYGGRLVILEKNFRQNGLKCHLLSSLSQNIINIFIGSIGAFVFLYFYLNWSPYLTSSISTIGIGVSVLLTIIYFGNSQIFKYFGILVPLKWRTKYLSAGIGVDVSIIKLNEALVVSMIRYLIFCCQYGLLLYFFGLRLDFIPMFSAISLIYLIQSGIPLPPFLSMLARGEIALIVWSSFSVSPISILSATFSLWILNLLIPSIIGAIILLRKY